LLLRSSRFTIYSGSPDVTRPEGTRYLWYSPAVLLLNHCLVPSHRSSRDRLGHPTYPVETQTFALAGPKTSSQADRPSYLRRCNLAGRTERLPPGCFVCGSIFVRLCARSSSLPKTSPALWPFVSLLCRCALNRRRFYTPPPASPALLIGPAGHPATGFDP
jgi:hypothetical protein